MIMKMQDIRWYFYSNVVVASAPSRTDVPASVVPFPLVATPHHWFSLCLIEVLFLDIQLHHLVSVLLLVSLLPISAKQ
jgi:hypothetical protein